ncbi:hypothetical protein BT93_L3943 [Corymbia citriodora subsp. variegata]|uniref:Uncharacterized protein n=1 Tax=Corymbia citriodora subsp. variegata TaxID=360336 RepID=A0A8T0CUZ1_CORYI|nr:hypothetical protein BT93_L3943 [Corymbia citriodora subsp. variegata]
MPNAKKNAGKEATKLSKLLKAPIWILIKARDFYVRSLTDCSGHIGYASVMGCPTGQINTLPRSFSVSSTKSGSTNADEDYRELVRLASLRSLSSTVGSDLAKAQDVAGKSPMAATNNKMPRSFSTGIGRIDEDKPCEFGEDGIVKADVYTRSRSYVPAKRTSGLI